MDEMASIQWHKTTSIIDSLTQDPCSFSFDQAVFILHQYLAMDRSVYEIHHDTLSDCVKFKAHVTMATQASPIYKLDMTPSAPTLWLNFLSLAGASGPLPLKYTENILNGLRKKETHIPDFLDIFNHRFASLWHKFHYQIHPSLSAKPVTESYIGKKILYFSGIEESPTNKDIGLAENRKTLNEILISYQKSLWKNNCNILELERILSHHLNLPIKIEPFQGDFQHIRPSEQTKIGTNGQWNVLGKTAVLGKKVWDLAAGILIKIGPVNQITQQELLPITVNVNNPRSLYSQLKILTKLFTPNHIKFKFQIDVNTDDIQIHPLQSIDNLQKYNRLGLNSWI